MPAFLRYTFIPILFLFCASHCLAQKHKKRPFYKGRYNAIQISKKKARVVCPVFENSKYPFHGLGIKLGDPFAVSYKFYAAKNFAIVLDFGSAASGLYYKYYKSRFSKYENPDSVRSEQDINYVGHKVESEWVGEGKLLYQHDASKLVEGLNWYIGAGWQVRQSDITYEYLVQVSFNQNTINKFNVNTFTMGPTAAIGLEYAYFELPISAFMEIEVFSDLLEDSGWMRLQGGAGLRYIF